MKLKYIGALAITAFLYDPAYIAYKTFYAQMPDLNKYGEETYALITGATDGIGKGFCEEFASRGVNIILVSRNQEKLDAVSKELRDKYSILTITHAIDLSKATKSDFESLKRKTDDVDVGILINNAGYVDYKTMKQLTYEEIESTLALNSGSLLHLLNMYLPVLEKRKKRSAVINLSSSLAIKPCPYVSLYSGTKGLNHYVTEGLSEEYKDSIDVLSFQPATVLTNATLNEKESWRTSTVKESVRGALLDLGRRNFTHGSANHELLAWGIKWLPTSIRLYLFGKIIRKTIKSRTGRDVKD